MLHLSTFPELKIHTPPGHLATARAYDSCLMLDYVHIINFVLLYYYYYIPC